MVMNGARVNGDDVQPMSPEATAHISKQGYFHNEYAGNGEDPSHRMDINLHNFGDYGTER